MPLMQHHIQPDEFGQALANGFEAEDRLRALVHFGGGCPECRRTFENLTGPKESSPKERTELPKHLDPIARALCRLREERRSSPVPVIHMTPIHHAWIERALHEPDAFCRLVIEEARLLELRGSGLEILEHLLDLLSDHRWIRPGDRARRDLRTLARIYLESARARRGDSDDRYTAVSLVRRYLSYGGGDHEIHAICALEGFRIESRPYSLGPELLVKMVRPHLDRFFEARSSPSHLAELWCLLAFEYHRGQCYSKALEATNKALCGIPERCFGYRIDALYDIAALSYHSGDFEGLRRYLPEVETLAEQHGDTRHATGLLGLRGNYERLIGNEQAASEALHQALEGCLKDGSRWGALHRLRDIRTLYLAHDRVAELASLQGQFLRIVAHPGAIPWERHHKDFVVAWATEFEIEDLEKVKERLR